LPVAELLAPSSTKQRPAWEETSTTSFEGLR